MTLLAALVSLTATLQSPSSRTAPEYQCIVMEATLGTADTMTVAVPRPQCGALRLVLVGGAKRIRPPGVYSWTRRFEIAVALVNTSSKPLQLPITMRVDSATPIQRGRQLNAFFVRNYLTFDFWDGQELQQPWTFTSSQAGTSVLAPGEQSTVRVIKVNTTPLAQRARVWYRIDGQLSPIPQTPISPPAPTPRQAPPDTLTSAISSFINQARFPKLRSATTTYRDVARDILIFSVSYGEAQDCPSGCFYSGAIGLQYGSQIGWLRVADYDQDTLLQVRIRRRSFPFSGQSPYLLSQEFADTLAHLFGRYSYLVDQVLLPLVLPNADLPRSRLVAYVDGLYSEIDQPLASLLVTIPKVQTDPELLTLLSNLPDGGPPYEAARERARARLLDMAPSLVADPRMPARTLFVLAQLLRPYRDTALMLAMADHPNVRNRPATLTVLARLLPRLTPRVISSVEASARAKALLTRYLANPSGVHDSALGWQLLRDPEAGASQDILAVLANTQIAQDQEIVWAASRRLPEEAFRSAEYPNVPLH